MAASDTSYMSKAAQNNEASHATPLRGKPVFVKHLDIPTVNERDFYTEHMYKALAKEVPSKEITGIQKIKGLWRLYIENKQTRINLITLGLKVRNVCVAVYDTNPFLVHGEDTLRLRIKDIPLSASDTLITDELESRKCKLIGKIIHDRLRVDGKLTDCLTGDRIVYIERPKHSLPRSITFGLFQGRVFHPGQLPDDVSTVTCSNCLVTGHHRSKCTQDVVCKQCSKSGHIARDCTEDFPPLPSHNTNPLTTGQRSRDLRAHSSVQYQENRDHPFATPPPPSNETLHDESRQQTESAQYTHHAPVTPCGKPSDAHATFQRHRDQLISNIRQGPGKSQAKITQFTNARNTLASEENAQRSAVQVEQDDCASVSQDDFSTAESENSDDESAQVQSELSAESPELHVILEKKNTKSTKRKQKSHKNPSKKK